MSEPKRIQVIRPHQNIKDFVHPREQNSQQHSHEQFLLDQKDYYAIGWRRLNTIQAIPLKENWPITIGNGIAACSSGFLVTGYHCLPTFHLYLGGMITHRMARNLSLHITLSTLPTSGACFFVVTLSHLSAYYLLVLRPMFSNDPMLCSTCLEIRSFAIGSLIPTAMGTSVAVLANLSACLLNKTIRLPKFNIQAYPEWKHLFRKHAFKGMSRRYFVAYPMITGFLASMIFLGQNYYWRNTLQQRLVLFENQSLSHEEPRKRNKLVGSVQDFFTKLFGSKVK